MSWIKPQFVIFSFVNNIWSLKLKFDSWITNLGSLIRTLGILDEYYHLLHECHISWAFSAVDFNDWDDFGKQIATLLYQNHNQQRKPSSYLIKLHDFIVICQHLARFLLAFCCHNEIRKVLWFLSTTISMCLPIVCPFNVPNNNSKLVQ